MLVDMHMHTDFSTDSNATFDSMAQAAIKKGLDAICITDHIDWDFPEPNMEFDFDMDRYEETLRKGQAQYSGKIRIGMGVELGLQPHLKEDYDQLLASRPFDFVIGSTHLMNGRDPYYPEAFEGLTDDQAFRIYFENILANVQAFTGFDSLGHLDYIVRYGQEKKSYQYKDYQDVIDEILKILVREGKALEVNTAGFRKKLGFPNPHPDVIKRYHQLGGEMITLGADAHKPAHVSYGMEQARRLLKECGFSYFTCFWQRKPHFIEL